MGSVWQYYELVSTQWPSVPYIEDKVTHAITRAPVNKRPTLINQGAGQIPRLLANTTMETYLMGPNVDKVDRNTSSCMACHNMARIGKPDPETGELPRADFSFLLQEAFPAAASKKLSEQRRQELSRAFHQDTSTGGQPTRAVPPKK